MRVLRADGVWGRRAVVGLVAALVSGAAMLAARVFASASTPVEMLFDLTGHLLGVPAVFNVIHALPYSVGDYAKYVLFGVMAVVYLLLWAALAVPLASLGRPLRVAIPTLATPALVGLALLPLEGLGALGLSPNNYFYPPLQTHLWAAAFGAVYGVVLLALGRGGRRPSAGEREPDASRRDALRTSARGLVLIVAGLGAVRWALRSVAQAASLEGFLAEIRGLVPAITPVKDHYVVSKNFVDPKVDAGRWRLRIHGLVEHPLELDLSQLKALPSVTRPTTLICISNEVGGHLVGNSVWTGVPMKDLLETAKVRPGATNVVLRAADNYSDSLPLDVARREGTMVAYLQDGDPLVRAHGFPARVLAPGLYGMKSVKWVVDVEVVDHPYRGYWEQRGWSETAVVRTMSRIDTPKATVLASGEAAIGGIAFAGLRGVKAVQVSVDGGKSWHQAILAPAESPYSWTLWGFEWHAGPGEYDAWVRAVDGEGKVQTAKRSQPLPNGASGYDEVRIRVS